MPLQPDFNPLALPTFASRGSLPRSQLRFSVSVMSSFPEAAIMSLPVGGRHCGRMFALFMAAMRALPVGGRPCGRMLRWAVSADEAAPLQAFASRGSLPRRPPKPSFCEFLPRRPLKPSHFEWLPPRPLEPSCCRLLIKSQLRLSTFKVLPQCPTLMEQP